MKHRFWVLVCLFPIVASAGERNSVSVNGQCNREALPDRGSITVTAEAEDKSSANAAKSVAKLYEKLRGEVKKLDLKDAQLQTSVYSVTPVYNYKHNPPQVTGYRARMGLTVETSDLARLGEVIELSAQNETQRVSQLRQFLSVKRLQEVQESCLEEAVKNARLKAEKMAKAAGASLGGVISLAESGAYSPQPMYDAAEAEAGAAPMMRAAPVAVESRKQEISLTVNAVFAVN